jgi:hypothetical protein
MMARNRDRPPIPPRSIDLLGLRFPWDEWVRRLRSGRRHHGADARRSRYCQSPLTFRVIGDGKALWASKPIQAQHRLENCSVAVTGVSVLELQVDCPEGWRSAHAVWLEPRLLNYTGEAKEPTTEPMKDKTTAAKTELHAFLVTTDHFALARTLSGPSLIASDARHYRHYPFSLLGPRGPENVCSWEFPFSFSAHDFSSICCAADSRTVI